jgi:hypothetical protein
MKVSLLKRNYSKIGQSLVELAIFSSVMFMAIGALVTYALNYNQYQRLTMLATMKANNEAWQAADTALSATVVLVYDKALPDISSTLGMFGVTKKRTLQVMASATRTNALYSQPEWGKEEELPRIIYIFNGNKKYSLTTSGFANRTFEYELVNTRNDDTPIKKYKTPQGKNFKRKEWREGWWSNTHFTNAESELYPPRSWQWVENSGTPETQVTSLSSWDIDDDNEEEQILNITTNTKIDNAGHIIFTNDEIKYSDRELGMLDSSESALDELRSGLIRQYYEKNIFEGELNSQQEDDLFSTFTLRNTNEQIRERYFRLNWRLEVGSPAFNNLTNQIGSNNPNPNCNYASGYFCSPSLPKDCDCIGRKEDVVSGLLELYPREPINIYAEVKNKNFLYEDIDLPNGEILKSGRLYVVAKSNDPNNSKTQKSVKVPLVSGNLFLIVRSSYKYGSPTEKIFNWERKNKD